MNFSKNFLLLLASLIFCFVAINCSGIPPSADENNEMIVNNARNEGHNGPFLPDNFFGSYKLIRPVNPKGIYLRYHFHYDHVAISGYFSYLLSKYLNEPQYFRHLFIVLTSYFVIFHLPSLFNLHWVASVKNPEDPNSTEIDELFLVEGTFPFDPKVCFSYLYSIHRLMTESLSALPKLRRFRR